MIESKGALTSKINWLGILILLTTALQDPVFADLFGSLFPAGMIDRLGYALGILVLYFRSNGEVNLPVDWKQPLKKALLALLFLPFLTAYANAGPVIGGGAGGGSGGAADNATIDSLIQQSHADDNATDSETRADQSVTPASLAYWSQNALTTRLMAWLAGGTITSIVVGDGNFTVDASGNVLMRTASYIRDDENPFCTQYYSGTNYDDNYTEICAPETGYSETYRLYWPAAAPTGDQVLVFPAPTLGKSQGTWENLAGGGDLVSTNNLDDVDNATTARRNLGLEIGVDVQAYDADLDTWAGVTPGADVGTALAVAAGSAGSF